MRRILAGLVLVGAMACGADMTGPSKADVAASVNRANATGVGCWITVPIPFDGGTIMFRYHATPCPTTAWLDSTYTPKGYTVVVDH